MIESQFSGNGTELTDFNATLLDDLGALVNETIQSGTPTSKQFLFATLTAFNATVNGTGTATSNQVGQSQDPTSGGSHESSLAMYVLTMSAVATDC